MKKERLLKGAYAFFGVLGTLILLYAWNLESGNLKDILFNLGTEIIGALIIFLVLDRFFLRDERTLVEEIRDLVSHLTRRAHHLKRVNDRSSSGIQKLIQEAKEVSLLACSGKGFLEHFKGDLGEMLKQGGTLRVILVNPTSSGAKSIKQSSETYSYENDFITAKQRLEALHNEFPKAQMQELKWAPGCSIIIIRSKADGDPFVQVGFYPPFFVADPEDRLLITFEGPTLQQWRNTYLNQFEQLWKATAPSP